jgi:N-acetylglucosaminyldiphosphoundecaprenol N-acetyl-beta-D-mannosaminyltransferase
VKNVDENIPRVSILGIPIFAGSFQTAIETILNNITTANNYLISATGAHGIVQSTKDMEFRDILLNFYLNLPDGVPNVWLGRLKGFKDIERCYGPDLFRAVISQSSEKKITHFLCGGKEGVAEKLKDVCQNKFSNFNIVGTFSPPFAPAEKFDYHQIGEIINNTGADIIWIGVSTPKQEYFAYNLSLYTKSKYLITVGAAFDFHIGAIKQAPNWIQRSGLEWLFRLIIEPRRLFHRYLTIVPLYIYLNLKDFITFVVRQK